MRIRSAIGDDDRVTTTFAHCERALSTAGTAQQQPPAHYWTSCAVYPFRLIHAVAGRVHVSVNYNARNDELAYLPSQPEPAAALAWHEICANLHPAGDL
jgi:hypothetical protein